MLKSNYLWGYVNKKSLNTAVLDNGRQTYASATPEENCGGGQSMGLVPMDLIIV
jgi:hypothetical protein